jgi:hypothetical protein
MVDPCDCPAKEQCDPRPSRLLNVASNMPSSSRFSSSELSLDRIPDGLLSRMYSYWHSKCQGRTLPDRVDIDPLDFPWALGWVCLLDVEHAPLRFRYRLEGSELSEEDGMRLTGQTTDAIGPPAYAALVHKNLSAVALTKRPKLHHVEIAHPDRNVNYLRLALPLSTGSGEVDIILTLSPPISDGKLFFERVIRGER